MTVKVCPLQGSACLKQFCRWWIPGRAECAVALLAESLVGEPSKPVEVAP